jgi:hypothetical protein
VKDGWFVLRGLLYWVTGIECENVDDVEMDLDNVSRYLQRNIDQLLDLYKYPDEFDKKIEHYRTTFRDRQIAVDKIRQDSSLEAAINSLCGGKK